MTRDPLEALHTIFGFEGFRGVQEGVIADAIAGRDVALVMPTGAGKSLCYQLPAICRPGTGIVISPLIALMQDQVRALTAAGVKAAALNSQSEDAMQVQRDFRDGKLDLLYVAPERARMESFRELVTAAPVNLFAIDEAHCVSQWGHDFRPDYRRLRALADLLPRIPRLALTATADAATRADICDQLGIAPDRLVVAGFDRPNIRYMAMPKRRPTDQMVEAVRAEGPVAGIVYCQTRKGAEQAATALVAKGVDARVYHAGLDATERTGNQKWFSRTEKGVMCATVAFGMGIDKPDIRFVVHMGLPKSIEAYYQETGRAGRDGQPAVATLIWGEGDVLLARKRIDDGDADAARKAHEQQQLVKLADWAGTGGCRRVPLLRHFGEPDPKPCGNCDNCLDPPVLIDVSEAARKLLSAAYRTGQMFGLGHLAKVLRGEPDERVEKHGHNKLALFGIGSDLAATQWQSLGRQLESASALVRDAEHGGLRLGDEARSILKGEAPVAIRRDEWIADKSRKRRPATDSVAPANSALFEALREWRRDRAKTDDVPAFVIFHDSTLGAIAERQPKTMRDLGGVPGIGAAKLDRFGDELLELLERY